MLLTFKASQFNVKFTIIGNAKPMIQHNEYNVLENSHFYNVHYFIIMKIPLAPASLLKMHCILCDLRKKQSKQIFRLAMIILIDR